MGDLFGFGLFAVLIGLGAAAFSGNRVVRGLGLLALLSLAVGGAVLTGWMLKVGVWGPRFTEGIGNFAMLVMAGPAGLVTWVVWRIFLAARDHVPVEGQGALTRLARVIRLLVRRGG